MKLWKEYMIYDYIIYIIKNKDLQIKNIGDITQIYKPPRYGIGPNGGNRQDPHNRQFISFDEAINL